MNEETARRLAEELILEASNVEYQSITDTLADEQEELSDEEFDKWARRIDDLICGASVQVTFK